MAEFVSKDEFNQFKNETNKKFDNISNDIKGFNNLLSKIDKKTDILVNDVENNQTTESLKIESAIAPIEKKQSLQEVQIKENLKSIEKIQENNKWLWRTIAGFFLTTLGSIVISAIKFFK